MGLGLGFGLGLGSYRVPTWKVESTILRRAIVIVRRSTDMTIRQARMRVRLR